MSTRSGKRLHSTFNEEAVKNELEVVIKSEKKGRAKRCKENEDDEEITLPKAKKRANYVSYPSDERKDAEEEIPEVKSTRKQKKNTLKEKNANIPASEVDHVDSQSTARVTRQTRRFFVNPDTAESSDVNSEPITTSSKGKSKKNKKKRSKNSSIKVEDNTDQKDVSVKSKKKKKGKKSQSPKEKVEKVKHNVSNISTDSFHSAAGSPLYSSTTPQPLIQTTDTEKSENTHSNDTLENAPRKTRSSSVKDNSFENRTSQMTEDNVNVSSDTEKSENVQINGTLEKITKKTRISCIKDDTFENKTSQIPEDKIDMSFHMEKYENGNLNGTFEKTSKKTRNSSIKNDTFEKESVQKTSKDNSLSAENKSENKTSTVYEETRRKSLRFSLTDNNNSVVLNSTFDKANVSKTVSLDTTYDKDNSKLSSSFNKHGQKTDSQKSSLISSDASNMTYDKNDRISITSDESQSFNIVNTTPVLVESSMDESALSVDQEATKPKSLEKPPTTPLKREGTFTKESEPVTPLKREGTFTKENPTVQKQARVSLQRMSLPSPGSTPFSLSRSSQKPTLNVTRSIEKPQGRPSRSSISGPLLSRQTRVMFCSPVNDPAALTQQKKTVIKSSMKGSNKSFVVQDTVDSPRVAGVKRSRSAAGGAGGPGAKRPRPQPPTNNTTTRTSRPNVPTKPTTPSTVPRSGSAPRTALPDFAALHRAQFARMESLTDCQRRKQLRARMLRTPSAPMQVLQRDSPKVSLTQTKEPSKKTETSSKESKLPNLMSLKPGFTRFGFKMNTPHENPFIIPAKTEQKKEKRNGVVTRSKLPAKSPKIVLPVVNNKIPQLNGVSRKEVVKQTVMREKSFASLSGKREAKREENRTVIKGVRTNRRFDLQMKMRNIE